jgi:hypothetical protein
VGTSERWVGTRKGGLKVNMVDVLVYVYKNRSMKPVEIVLRRGRKKRENDGGGKSKIYCKHICKYHIVPLRNYFMLIKLFLLSCCLSSNHAFYHEDASCSHALLPSRLDLAAWLLLSSTAALMCTPSRPLASSVPCG